MSNKPLVSIVTPSFNSGSFVEATIRSVLDQGYPAIEHIICDGGSTDNTIDILKKYPHLNWVSEPDKGQSDAINKGFAKAKGEFIGWLNSDDIYHGANLTAAVDYLEKHPDVDMIYTDLYIIDEAGNRIGSTEGKPFSLMGVIKDNPVKQPTLLMRRRVIDELKGVDKQYHFVMDRELWLRMAMAGMKVTYLPGEFFASFRLCSGTKTFEGTPNFRQEWFEVMSKAFQTASFDAVSEAEKDQALRENRSAYHLALMNQCFREGNKKEAWGHAKKVMKYQPSIKGNRGYWKQLAFGMIGIEHDRVSKFED